MKCDSLAVSFASFFSLSFTEEKGERLDTTVYNKKNESCEILAANT
jgi:hypothetical protein